MLNTHPRIRWIGVEGGERQKKKIEKK